MSTPLYQEVLTPSEIRKFTSELLKRKPGLPRTEIDSILEELAILATSAMLFQGIIAGDLEVIGVEEGELRVKSSNHPQCFFH